MSSTPRKIEVFGFEMLEKETRLSKGASSGNIYLPKNWAGKRVVVIRID
jgi:putative transposon-encoded protein